MKKNLLFLLFCVFLTPAFSQINLRTVWSTCLEPNTEYNYHHKVVNTPNGYLTSENNSAVFGNPYGIVRKFDKRGRQLWRRDFAGNGFVEILSIKYTSDGGFIVAGRSLANDGIFTGNPINTQNDPYGNDNLLLWSFVMKFDRHARLQWKNFNPDGYPAEIIEKPDGSFLLITSLHPLMGGDISVWATSFDQNGNVVSGSIIECLSHLPYVETAVAAEITQDGFVVLANIESLDTTYGNHVNPYGGIFSDYFAFKLDWTGELVWARCLGGTLNDVPYDMESSPDGGFIITGWSESSDGDVMTTSSTNKDIWTLKLDSLGNIVWQDKFGGNSDDLGFSLDVKKDGSSIVCGYLFSRNVSPNDSNEMGVGLIGYSNNGTRDWYNKLSQSEEAFIQSITTSGKKDFVVFGTSSSMNPSNEIFNQPGSYLIRFRESNIPNNQLKVSDEIVDFSPYPNPCDTRFSLRLDEESTVQVFDLNGRMILPASENVFGVVEVKTDMMQDGMYLVRVTTKGNVTTKRIIVSHR